MVWSPPVNATEQNAGGPRIANAITPGTACTAKTRST